MILFEMQKCLHLKDELKKKKPKLDGEYILRRKKDGWYTYIPYVAATKTWYPVRSSANRVIPAFEWMYHEDVLAELPKPNIDAILIAEAVIPDMLFPEMNGIFNRSVGNFDCRDVEFLTHDLVFTDSYSMPALEREKELAGLDFGNLSSRFKKLPIELVSQYHDKLWTEQFDRFVLEGDEGYVAKSAKGGFFPGKRNAGLIKKKLEVEIDCLAVRLEETIGEKGNPSLTLISRRKSGTEIRTVINRHSLQKAWIADLSAILGKVVTIRGMEVYPDGQIRQPTFYCIRHDKGAEDYE